MEPEDEFAELFVTLWPRLVRMATAIAGDRSTAEDAVQMAFARAYASWSRVRRADHSTLEPTTPDGDPIVLEQGPVNGNGFGWWTLDTDGSVLLATGKDYGDFTVYDCLLPSGACEKVGTLQPTGGDPMFIGNDM